MWQSITEPQATIISAILTILAAVIGVSLGAKLFDDRVRDLKSALDQSKALVTEHRNKVEEDLAEIKKNFGAIRDEFSITNVNLGNVQDAIGEIAGQGGSKGTEGKARARVTWTKIRGILESIAANPEIDGRTRAKYARIDRRSYETLVEALATDENLSKVAAEQFLEAINTWHRIRPNRSRPTEAMLDKLDRLADSLTQEETGKLPELA